MATKTPRKTRFRTNDSASRMVCRTLANRFGEQSVQAYRFNSASIRVRIISEEFANKGRTARERIVNPALRKLPEEIRRDIIMLLLLTPQEHQSSAERMDLLDLEFDDPGGSSF